MGNCAKMKKRRDKDTPPQPLENNRTMNAWGIRRMETSDNKVFETDGSKKEEGQPPAPPQVRNFRN